MEFEDAGFGFVSCKKQGYVMCRINHKEQGEDHVAVFDKGQFHNVVLSCLLYTSPSPRDQRGSRMPSSA